MQLCIQSITPSRILYDRLCTCQECESFEYLPASISVNCLTGPVLTRTTRRWDPTSSSSRRLRSSPGVREGGRRLCVAWGTRPRVHCCSPPLSLPPCLRVTSSAAPTVPLCRIPVQALLGGTFFRPKHQGELPFWGVGGATRGCWLTCPYQSHALIPEHVRRVMAVGAHCHSCSLLIWQVLPSEIPDFQSGQKIVLTDKVCSRARHFLSVCMHLAPEFWCCSRKRSHRRLNYLGLRASSGTHERGLPCTRVLSPQ